MHSNPFTRQLEEVCTLPGPDCVSAERMGGEVRRGVMKERERESQGRSKIERGKKTDGQKYPIYKLALYTTIQYFHIVVFKGSFPWSHDRAGPKKNPTS